MEELQGRAGRGIALAALAVACVVIGPAPRLTEALERTYAVAVEESRRERRSPGGRVPATTARHQHRPGPVRPRRRRP